MSHCEHAGSESITQDFATVVYRQQLLGFNAVRLPFSFSIFDAPPKTQTYQCTQVSRRNPRAWLKAVKRAAKNQNCKHLMYTIAACVFGFQSQAMDLYPFVLLVICLLEPS